jgi:alpha-beta hydrolase superfamily lysophospholipase
MIALSLCITSAVAQNTPNSLEGYWEGAVVREGSVRIIRLEFFQGNSGLRAAVEMPDLFTYGLGSTAVKQEGGKVSLRIPLVGDVSMMLDDSTREMVGTVGTTTPPVTIHIKRSIKLAEAPIKKEEVQFSSGDLKLAGTLVMPVTQGPHPAIVWIHGRGGTLREESQRTRLLAQRGVASLIYDKRGSGKSTGDLAKAKFDDLVNDVVAAVQYLSTRKDINARQIGLHGESAGGWIAPVVVTRSKVPVAFVMTSAGPAESLYDQQIHAYQYMLRQTGENFTKEELELGANHVRLRMQMVFRNEGREEFLASAAKVKETKLARFLLYPEAQDARDIDWLRRNECDPVPHLKKISAPFLAFFGSKDYIVPPEENAARLEKLLTEAGNKDFKVVVIEGGDHDLAFDSGEGKDKRWMWGRVSTEYVDTMVEWLLKRVTVAR